MKWRELDIRLFAVAASVLLSLLVIATQKVPNDDSYTYIRTAEIFLERGIGAALENYTWPVYSIGIGIVASITSLELFTSALVLNGFFFALLTWSFVSLVQCTSADKRIAVIGALTILLYPQINEYRYLIIRDPGFWAFGFFAIWRFVKLYQNTSLEKDWLLTLPVIIGFLVAGLFRGEALLYLFLLPFALLIKPTQEQQLRKKRFINCFALIVAFLLSTYLLLRLLGFHVLIYAIDFIAVYLPFLQDLVSSDPQRQHEIATVLFNEHAANYSTEFVPLFIFISMAIMLLITVVQGIGAPFTFIFSLRLFHSYRAKKAGAKFKRANQYLNDLFPVLLLVIITNLLLLITFLAITKFLSLRYTMMLTLTAALIIPFVIDSYLARFTSEQSHSKENLLVQSLTSTFSKPLIAVFFAYCLIDAYYSFGDQKPYIVDAVEWVQENSSENIKLLTNNHAVAYGSGLVEAYDKIELSLSIDDIRSSLPGSLIAAEHSVTMDQVLEAAKPSGILELLASFPDNDPEISIYIRTTAK